MLCNFLLYFIFEYVGQFRCILAHMLKAKDNMHGPILFLHHVSPKDQTQVFSLGGQLSFLLGLIVCLISVF